MMKIYLASPFFNKNEINAVTTAEQILRERGFDVFSPREHENRTFEVGTKEWSKSIFEMDSIEIDKSDVMVMLYHGGYSDSGTAWECGYAYAKGISCVVVHLGNNSNLMIHEGCWTNLNELDELKTYDFITMPIFNYKGEMF